MKRIFVRAGVSLVGLMAWLLPNRAMADYNCSVTVGDDTVTWSCPADELCEATVTYSNGNVSIQVACV